MRSLLPSSCPADRPPRTQRATLRARVRACLAPLAALALSCGLLLGGPGPAAAQTGPDASDEAVAQLEAGLHQQAAGRFYELYQVRPGDTVENIAARFGISPERIRTLNRVSPSAQPNPGRAIAIPITRPRPSAEMPAPAADPAPRDLQPRYASVIASTPIRTQPNSPSAEVLYQPELGAQLIVVAEQADHWGVVMVDGSTGWIPKTSAQLTDQTIDPDTLDAMLKGGRPDIVQEAFRYLGTPYRYGGHLPYNLDCSLLVQTVFASRGLRLPRTANAQYDHGQSVNSSNLLPGDRLYFVSKSGRINHTGIYIGGGRFIHASSRRGRVAVDKLAEPMYRTRFAGARRS